VDNSWRPQLVL